MVVCHGQDKTLWPRRKATDSYTASDQRAKSAFPVSPLFANIEISSVLTLSEQGHILNAAVDLVWHLKKSYTYCSAAKVTLLVVLSAINSSR